MNGSFIALIITAILGPILTLAIKELFEYLKKEKELKLSVAKLITERKLHFAEQATNIWLAQNSVFKAVSELAQQASVNIELLGEQHFSKVFANYCSQLDDLSKRSYEVSNAVHLYFDIEVPQLNYDPMQKLAEVFTIVQQAGSEYIILDKLLSESSETQHVNFYTNKLDAQLNIFKSQIKLISNITRDCEVMSKNLVEALKKEVSSEYSIKISKSF